MTNPDFPTIPPQEPAAPRTRSNCFVVGGITCLVVLIIGILITIWLVVSVSKNPTFKKVFSGAKLVAECQLHLANPSGTQDIYDALERYKTRYGQYPAKLADLYPTFLEDKAILHCPADTRPKDVVSYDYYPPTDKSPANAVIVECRRHVVMEGQPPLVLQLTKDGQVLKQNFTPRGTPVEAPKTSD